MTTMVIRFINFLVIKKKFTLPFIDLLVSLISIVGGPLSGDLLVGEVSLRFPFL